MYSHNELIILVCYISRALCFPRCRKCNVRGLLVFKCTLCERVPYMRSRSAWTVNKQLPRVIAHLAVFILFYWLIVQVRVATSFFTQTAHAQLVLLQTQKLWLRSYFLYSEWQVVHNVGNNSDSVIMLSIGANEVCADIWLRSRDVIAWIICTSWHILNTFKTTQPQHDYDHYVVLVRVSYWI